MNHTHAQTPVINMQTWLPFYVPRNICGHFWEHITHLTAPYPHNNETHAQPRPELSSNLQTVFTLEQSFDVLRTTQNNPSMQKCPHFDSRININMYIITHTHTRALPTIARICHLILNLSNFVNKIVFLLTSLFLFLLFCCICQQFIWVMS